MRTRTRLSSPLWASAGILPRMICPQRPWAANESHPPAPSSLSSRAHSGRAAPTLLGGEGKDVRNGTVHTGCLPPEPGPGSRSLAGRVVCVPLPPNE